MNKRIAYSLLVFLLFFFVACNQAGESRESDSPALEAEQEPIAKDTWTEGEEAGFFEDVYYNNLLIIRYSEEAEKKASKRALQNFAAQTAEYHQILNSRIEQMTEHSDFHLPEKVNDLAGEHLQEMQEKSGNEFDKAYLDVLSDIQDKLETQFREASESAMDPELRNWAEKILSNIKSHQLAVAELKEETTTN